MDQNTVERASSQLRLLEETAVAANEAHSVEPAFRFALRRICEERDWPLGHVLTAARDEDSRVWARPTTIWHPRHAGQHRAFRQWRMRDPDVLQRKLISPVLRSRKAAWVDLSRTPEWTDAIGHEIGGALAFPILVRRDVAAVLEFFTVQREVPSDDFVETMTHIGAQMGRVVERQQMLQEVAEASVREQQRIGRELHDSASQILTGVAMIAEKIKRELDRQDSPLVPKMAELLLHLREARSQVHAISRGLMPVDVAADGLRAALQNLSESVNELDEAKCALVCKTDVEVADTQVATHLYRIAQEATQNAIKHGSARTIQMSLAVRGQRATLRISDDGAGFRPRAVASGVGLRLMRHRAAAIGGELTIRSSPGKGTIVRCNVPIRSELLE